MGLNIKNERVHALARQAAALTGKTQTGAIEEALVQLLDRYDADPARTDRQRRLDLLLELGEAWGPPPAGSVAEVEDLYDEQTGLPA